MLHRKKRKKKANRYSRLFFIFYFMSRQENVPFELARKATKQKDARQTPLTPKS